MPMNFDCDCKEPPNYCLYGFQIKPLSGLIRCAAKRFIKMNLCLRITFRQTAVVFGDQDLTSLRLSLFKDTKNHWASTLHLAKPCFSIAYPVCERRFAVLLCVRCSRILSTAPSGTFLRLSQGVDFMLELIDLVDNFRIDWWLVFEYCNRSCQPSRPNEKHYAKKDETCGICNDDPSEAINWFRR